MLLNILRGKGVSLVNYPELDDRIYHGSDEVVSAVDLLKGEPKKDFGQGFYTTTDRIQAEKFARLKTNRVGGTKGHVSVFAFKKQPGLRIKRFISSNEEWFDFVLHNRGYYRLSSFKMPEVFDIIIGPVANDAVGTVLNLFVSGTYGNPDTLEAKKTAIRLLLTQKLHDQVFFATEPAIAGLTFIEVYDVYTD